MERDKLDSSFSRAPLLPKDVKDCSNPHGTAHETAVCARCSRQRYKITTLTVLVFISLLGNLYLYGASQGLFAQQSSRSKYAGLEYDQPTSMVHATEYANPNLTAASALWWAIDSDKGTIAVPHTEAKRLGLADTQPYVWDHSKGVYVINAYHSLHCIKVIHLSFTEFNSNQTQTYPTEHITHCLDQLRRDAICHADDTPRYITPGNSSETGVGQIRMCRSWDKLQAWADSHNACYRRISKAANEISQFERWKFCPMDSPDRPVAQEHFAKHMSHGIDEGIGWSGGSP